MTMPLSSTDRRALPGHLILFAAALAIYRLLIIDLTPVHLFFDEAYYLSWAQTPDWGYYSKPPVVAWVIALTTWLMGDSEWAVKSGAALLYSLTALLLADCGRRLFDRATGTLAGYIVLLMPIISFNSLFITTDAPLLFFWTLSIWLFLRAEASNALVWWLLAGLAGGMGLLSKYTFILLPSSFLLLALISPRGRAILANPRFWLACAVALLCLMPNLYWNYRHDFISFQHTAEISHQDESSISLTRLLEFWLGQAAVLGPLLTISLLRALFRRREERSEAERFAWSLFWPIFVVISAQALLARANINWAAPAYIGAALVIAHHLTRWDSKVWSRTALGCNLLLALVFYHYAFWLSLIGIEPSRHNDPYKRVLGWPELVAQLQPQFDQHPQLPLASDSRRLLAYFGYYLTPHRFDGYALNIDDQIDDHYELMRSIGNTGPDELMFVSQSLDRDDLLKYFSTVELLGNAHTEVLTDLSREAQLFRVSGYRPAQPNKHADRKQDDALAQTD